MRLRSNIPENDLHQVVLGDHLLACWRLLFLIRGQRKAGVSLEKEALHLEVVFDVVLRLVVVDDVLKQFKDDAAEAPEVRSLIVLLL